VRLHENRSLQQIASQKAAIARPAMVNRAARRLAGERELQVEAPDHAGGEGPIAMRR